MRTLGTFLVTATFACVAGCGGGSSKGTSSSGRSGSTGGQCPSSSSGQVCTGEDAYSNCEMAACGTQYKACFGNGYASGNFSGGACADFINCEMACPCDATATTCESNCTAGLATTAGATCLTCLTTLSGCVDTGAGASCTQPVCTTTSTNTNTATNTTTSTTTSTGTNCVALQTCCTKITDATVKSACQSSITSAGGVDSTCAAVVQGFQQAGYCP